MLAAIIPLLALCSCGPKSETPATPTPPAPQKFASLEELQQSAALAGYSVLGKFGTNWPGTLKTITEADDEISFAVNDRKHRYPGYTGYHLKVAILTGADGQEMAFVFRSATKR